MEKNIKKRRSKKASETIMSDSTLMILIALERKELHRYGIKTYIEKTTNGQFIVPTATIYASITKFENLGIVERTNKDYTQSTYRLTDVGRDVLRDKTKDVIKTLEMLKGYRPENDDLLGVNLNDLTKGSVDYELTSNNQSDKWLLDVLMASHELSKLLGGISFSLRRGIRFSTAGTNFNELWKLIETGLKEVYGYRNIQEIYLNVIVKLFSDMELEEKDIVLKSGKGQNLGILFNRLGAAFLNFTLYGVITEKSKIDKNIYEINKITSEIEKYIEKHSV